MAENRTDVVLYDAINVITYWEQNIGSSVEEVDQAVYTSMARGLVSNRNASSDIIVRMNKFKQVKTKGGDASATFYGAMVGEDDSIKVGGTTGAGVKIGAQGDYDTIIGASETLTFGNIDGFGQAIARDAVDLAKNTADAYRQWQQSTKEFLEKGDVPFKELMLNNLLANEAGKRRDSFESWFEECIPCDTRIEFLSNLDLFGDFLTALENDIKSKLDYIENLIKLLFSPSDIDDLCEFAKLFSFMCIPDLYAMVMFLVNYINGYLMTILNFKADASAALMALVSAIFNPLTSLLGSIINGYFQLVLGPVDCLIEAVKAQLDKIPSDFTLRDDGIQVSTVGATRRKQLEEAVAFFRDVNKRRSFDLSTNERITFDQIESRIEQKGKVENKFDHLKNGMEFVYLTMVAAKQWTEDQIKKLQQWIEDFLAKMSRENSKVLDVYRIINNIQTMVALILVIIKLIKNKGIYCDGSTPMLDTIVTELALSEFYKSTGGAPAFVPKHRLPENIRNLPGIRDSDYVIVPSDLIDTIEVTGDAVTGGAITGGAITASLDVDKFGTIKVPVKLIRSCENAIKFEQNERMRQWMEEVMQTRS